METLAIVLAILFVGEIIDLKGERAQAPDFAFILTAASFGGALAIGIYLVVTA